MIWAWGQFLDHNITITRNQSGSSPETLPITTPLDDAYPGYTIPFTRSVFQLDSGGVRQQTNGMSSFIDGAGVYGFDSHRAYALRKLDGTGKLKDHPADNGERILPYNVNSLDNESPPGTNPTDFFLAGDVRANEVVFLISLHVLFVREHNRLCEEIIDRTPTLLGNDEVIYQQARRMVSGFIANITYNEFLPAILGKQITGIYNSTVNPTLATEFSTFGYRIGHSMISSEIQIGNNVNNTIAVRDSFFNPSYIQQNGSNAVLFGLTQGLAQNVDGVLVEDLRTFLFGPPSMNMLHDLAALNIQRGRDHGIPGYNTVRQAYGLGTFATFNDIPTSQSNRDKLAAIYESPNFIDPWIGAIVENHVPGAVVGELVSAILTDQFTRLRAGDRFFFENDNALSPADKVAIRNTKLSDVLSRNTSGFTFAIDVFRVPS
jgi:hypothetical protein